MPTRILIFSEKDEGARAVRERGIRIHNRDIDLQEYHGYQNISKLNNICLLHHQGCK